MAIQMNNQELHAAFWQGGHGFCKACEVHFESGVDPDAHGSPCEVCGKSAVYGLEELLIAGEIYIIHAAEQQAQEMVAAGLY